MSRLPAIITSVILLLAFDAASGQARMRCEIGSITDGDGDSLLSRFGTGDPSAFEFQVGELEARFGNNPTTSMSGGVLLRRGDRLAGADSASYDPIQRAFSLAGNVRYEDSGTAVVSSSAEFGYVTGRIRFEGAEFQLGSRGRGQAGFLEINQEGRLELGNVGYTTCPSESEDWIIQADDIVLDTTTGVGEARDVKLRFKGVPILYSPYLSFPITDARKSGILTPEIGRSGRSGNELSVPYYWNIAPNYDATLTPRLLTARGLQMGAEIRYLLSTSTGEAQVEYLPDDSKLNDNRHLVSFAHRTLFNNGWRNLIDFRQVSDSQYFEDLGGSLSISSITHLNRSATFDFYGEHWSMLAMFQDYQTIDQAIAPVDKPYRRLPQILVSGHWADGFLGLDYGFDSEVVNFDRDVGTTGWRLNASPSIELAIERPGWFFRPAVKLDHTQYELENRLPGEETDPSRTLPSATVDMGLNFERLLNGSGRVQTIEPRILYTNVPFRVQDQLPVFDTIQPDLNLVQLYRGNRYLGVDRITDTDQLSVGVTSRIIETGSGRELMSATIGQALYLSNQSVMLPGQPSVTGDASDYIAELRFLIYDNLNFDIGHQWSDNGTTKSEARLQYRPASNKILNFAYRFRQGSLEQGDVSWSWPIGQSWNFVGRYNFSLRDNKVLEQFYGLEYESCCWGLRLVGRRYISTRDGTQDSSIGLQLVLKGMTSVGTAAGRLLERGILGYSGDLH
ncbi:MAG: LPS assembly protein LptD [Woeseiaceae bacterium]|nr:LPS assembly protein LptD [Woeseiaceae bacterium]